jgi:hypothetical protein
MGKEEISSKALKKVRMGRRKGIGWVRMRQQRSNCRAYGEVY